MCENRKRRIVEKREINKYFFYIYVDRSNEAYDYFCDLLLKRTINERDHVMFSTFQPYAKLFKNS